MPNACSFFLHSGRPCGAPPLRNSNWCRHHAPAEPAEPSQNGNPDDPGTDPETDNETSKAAIAAYWRSTFHHSIVACETEEALQQHIQGLLSALFHQEICHRSAGRLFAAIARRLAAVRTAAIAKAEENVRAEALKHGIQPGDRLFEALKSGNQIDPTLFEALKHLPFNEVNEAKGPQTNRVTP